MSYGDICRAVEKLRSEYRETDPFELCSAVGIRLIFQNLGDAPDAIKGFYLEYKRIRTVTVNADLPPVIQRVIAAHELGHAVLHRDAGVYAFHDVTTFDQATVMEKEANMFAAELLLDDAEVIELLNRDNTFFSAAALLMVPAELLDFKFRMLKWKGYQLREPPVSAQSTFLRDIEVPDNGGSWA